MSSLIGDLKFLTQNPAEVNVVDSTDFHSRICNVFKEISSILQRSAGPCGAPAVISNMPSYHITKDGYTIAKNIMYDNYKGYLDQVITYMITDICERLNNVVGDGTTAAILCTNKMFQAISEPETMEQLRKAFFLPRDILYRMHALKTLIINELMASAKNIKDLPHDEMVAAIRDVVYISSNGNNATADMIADVYDTIGSPAIMVEQAKDGITKCVLTDGFELKAQLTDEMYINSDTGHLNVEDLSILMFDFKVGAETFNYVILPVVRQMKKTRPGKRLLVLAPSYDTVALRDIAMALNRELEMTGTVMMVLAVYPNASATARKTADDFSMLTNMHIITEGNVDDIRNRQIAMIQKVKSEMASGTLQDNQPSNIEMTVLAQTAEFILGEKTDQNAPEVWPRVGHVDRAQIGIKTSTFSGFSYNEHRYKANLRDAEKNYREACDQYRATGNFNFEIDDCLARINSLHLKTAIVYVGSDTEFSMKFDKDAMDDAVRAAQSAYFNGIVIGEHISMIAAIQKVLQNTENEQDRLLLNIMLNGFVNVNFAILENGFANEELSMNELVTNISLEKREIYIKNRDLKIVFPDKGAFDSIWESSDRETRIASIYDFIVAYEIKTGTALDLNASDGVITFNTTVINSAATDREILTAAIDLIGLLLTSNQLIIARPNAN